MLSVSIGLFNLFPIPMLDGGHLFFYLIEAVRGRPLSPRVQDLGFRIGFALVIMLFIFVTFNDIAKFPGFSRIPRDLGDVAQRPRGGEKRGMGTPAQLKARQSLQ